MVRASKSYPSPPPRSRSCRTHWCGRVCQTLRLSRSRPRAQAAVRRRPTAGTTQSLVMSEGWSSSPMVIAVYMAKGCQHIQKDVLALYRPSAQCAIQATVVGADPAEIDAYCFLLAAACPPPAGSVGPAGRAPGDDETSSPTPWAGAVGKAVAPNQRAAVRGGVDRSRRWLGRGGAHY